MSDDEVICGGLVIARPMPIYWEEFGQPLGHTFMSDLHIGSVHTDYELIKKELQFAKEKGDRIAINGDVFDLILPSDHKRFKADVLHPRMLGRTNIVNEAIKWATELFTPVVDLIDGIGCGNHETALEKHHSYDPILALIYELEKVRKAEGIIHHLGYTGFIDYRYRYKSRTQRAKTNSNSKRFVPYYHHGAGGSAPVTKGMIDFNRKDVWVVADAIWFGHKHNRLMDHIYRMSCPESGDQPRMHDVRHIMTGAYFDTYKGQSQQSIRKHGRRANYAADAGFAPQGKGGSRVEIRPLANGPETIDIKVIQ